MTDKKDEALKLALSVLDEVRSETFRLLRNGQKLYAEQKVWNAIFVIKQALADSALDSMADNARELGLDYEPPCKTGSQCTSKCQQCDQPAQQRHISYVCPQCYWSLDEQPAQGKTMK